MNFDGLNPLGISRFCGLVDWDDPTQLPIGIAAISKNSRYTAQSVGTRYGLKRTINSGKAGKAITGLSLLKYLANPDVFLPLLYINDGSLVYENPAGSGNSTPVADGLALLAANINAQIGLAYQNAYIAQGDLIRGTKKPVVFNGNTKTLDPASDKPVGVTWSAATTFRVGHVVTPTVPNSHSYRASAVTTGISAGVEPVWPLGEGGVIVDGGVTWTELTPILAQVIAPVAPVIARVAAVGTFPVNRDVYIKITVKNSIGESIGSTALSIINTVLNDRVQVTLPALAAFPGWVQTLGAPYPITGLEVYEADVATGAAAPADGSYRKVAGGPFAFSAVVNVDAAAGGTVIPILSGAYVVPNGNICGTTRWMIVLYKNRNGYITGVSDAMPVSQNLQGGGRSLYAANIFTGPAPYTAKRICAFTVAGGSSAGPYFYIPANETVDAIVQTATVIADNVTTTATFNFVDKYLLNANEVTDYFDRIEIPETLDCYYSRALNRMIYANVTGFPTHCMVSEEADPEAVRDPGSIIKIGENNGERVVCWREIGQSQYCYKEESGHLVTPNGGDPQTWAVVEKWRGSAPCGPRAVDSTTEFSIYAHPSGAWRHDASGNREDVSIEIKKLWKRINWQYKQTIWTKIDEQNKEVLFGVPLDGAVTPNKVLRVNYQMGWGLPVVFIRGRWVPNPEGRKWSLDDISANCAAVALRDLTVAVDSDIDHRQLLIGGNDQYARMPVPSLKHDEDTAGASVAIDWQWRSVFSDNPTMAVMYLGGATLSATGNKNINVKAIRDDGASVYITNDKRKWQLGANENKFDAICEDQWERYAIQLDNGNVVDAWAEIHKAILWMRPMWNSRRA